MSAPDHEYHRESDPPGAVSDQNGEEAESFHREDHQHPEPRTRGHRLDPEKSEPPPSSSRAPGSSPPPPSGPPPEREADAHDR